MDVSMCFNRGVGKDYGGLLVLAGRERFWGDL
jgi:hypothetical protein